MPYLYKKLMDVLNSQNMMEGDTVKSKSMKTNIYRRFRINKGDMKYIFNDLINFGIVTRKKQSLVSFNGSKKKK